MSQFKARACGNLSEIMHVGLSTSTMQYSIFFSRPTIAEKGNDQGVINARERSDKFCSNSL